MSKTEITRADLNKHLNRIINMPLWSVVAGAGTGATISFGFGSQILRDMVLSNSHLSEDQKMYVGEISAMINCAWRIEKNRKLVCGSGDSNKEDGQMLKGLKAINNAVVKSIEINMFLDLVITFNDDSIFRTFCNATEPDEYCYYFIFEEEGNVYSVESNSVFLESAM